MPNSKKSQPAPEAMLGLIRGYWISQMVFVAARLGIADLLASGPRKPEAIAKQVGAEPERIHRLLRALASVGVFAEQADGRFKLTPLAQTLRGGRPDSLRDFALMMIDDYNRTAWGGLEHAVRTRETAFDHVLGRPLFDWLVQHPDKERAFSASMASISGTQNEAIARAYPWGRLSRLVDVGGAHGHLLATILRRHTKLSGVLYDQPQVVATASRSGFISAPEVRARIETAGGSFFDSVPAGADGYLMKYIIHDWDDEKCVRILENCRSAMAPGGRVLIVEHVIPKGNAADFGKLLDVNMMVLTGGKERTRKEFAELLARAGLRLSRVVATARPVSIVEGVRA
jgi:hypothetical protein